MSVRRRLTEPELLELFVRNGFPVHLAVSMGAVAIRESGGDPHAFNGNAATHDLSYGLTQINLFGQLGVVRLAQFRAELGLKAPEDLFDADMNARAAALIWNRDNRNLVIAWGLHLPGVKERYEVHLPAMQAAALTSGLGL